MSRLRARLAMKLRMLADRIDDETALAHSGFHAHYTRETGFTITLGGSTGLPLWYFRNEYPRVDEPLPDPDPIIDRFVWTRNE